MLDKYEGETRTATELVGRKWTERVSKETRIWIIQRACLRGTGGKKPTKIGESTEQRNTRQGREWPTSKSVYDAVETWGSGGGCMEGYMRGCPKEGMTRFGEIYILVG